MASLDSVLTRQALAEGVVRQHEDDESIALRLRYVGTGTVTSVTVDTATDFEVITSDGGTDTYAFATYTTVGSLADAINADGIFEVVVLDALRSDSTGSSAFVNGAITSGTDENGVVVWDVLSDTSAVDYATVTLSPKSPNFDMPKGRRVHVQEISYNQNVSAAEQGAVRIYRRRGATETLIFAHVSVDATVTTINFASGEGKITGKPDDEFIFRVLDTTSITDDAANYIRIVGVYE